MNEHTNGLSSQEMIKQMYGILVTGFKGSPPLPEQVRTNAKEIKYLKHKPDNLGKWTVRIIQFITLMILIYITFIKGKI